MIKIEIYTLGHSNYPFDKFIEILKKHNINCIVDIRGIPYSKYNTQYNKEVLQSNLRKLGYADFDKVIQEDIFKNGIERLKVGCSKGYKIVLLGAMQDPIRCHRAILMGRELIKAGFDVKHIMHEGDLKTQDYLEEKLLEKYFEGRNQLTIDSLLGNAMSREDMIEESYKLANREIGYRLEKLKYD